MKAFQGERAMPIRSRDLMLNQDHLRHQAQSCDWFLFSFEKIAGVIAAERGLQITLNQQVLREDFSRWHGFFLSSKQALKANRREFVLYAAGLMARELLRSRPALQIEAGSLGRPTGQWPEGYCIFRYCSEVAAAILEEEFGEHVGISADWAQQAFWASLKENISEDPRYAVPALKQILGEKPNWQRLDLPPEFTSPVLFAPDGSRLH
jgi:hypothetical protein